MAKVFIQINNDYAIGSDQAARSWTIVKRKVNIGEMPAGLTLYNKL